MDKFNSKPKLKVGDKVTISNDAFDEQIEQMETPEKVYTVSEVQDWENGQHIWLKEGVRLVEHNSGEVRISTSGMHYFWCNKK